jgi:hypothetical protein
MTWCGQLLAELVLLDVVAPTPTSTGAGSEVYPQAGQGFAAYLLGGFLGLGVIVLAMILLSIKPKRADPRLGTDHQREEDQADEQ